MYHQIRTFHTADIRSAVRRFAALLTVCCLLLSAVSCRSKPDDDKTMTQSVVKSYLDAFGGYQIPKMNQVSLTKLETYDDSNEINTSCKLLTSRTARTMESITVSGNSAIAQVSITMPRDFDGICREALDNAMLQMEQDTSERLPAEILNLSIKKYANQAEKVTVTAEISLSKVNNKWYIVKSQDIVDILSDIRTSVAAVYSVLDD